MPFHNRHVGGDAPGRPPAARSPAGLPEGERVYTIGDIHGRADLLKAVQARIDAHLRANPVERAFEVYLGDYIDRGAESRAVLDLLIRRAETVRMIALAGNHEEVFLRAFAEPDVFADWLTWGGRETLLSYGVVLPFRAGEAQRLDAMRQMNEKVPEAHVSFIASLPIMHVIGDYVFVHAGLRPNVALQEQEREDVLWIRKAFLSHRGPFPLKVVHGHTPAAAPEVLPNRINIDTGAYITGKLTCLTLEDQKVYFI